jgi:hypothetical protein
MLLAPLRRGVPETSSKVPFMLARIKFALAVMLAASVSLGALADAADAKPRKKTPAHRQDFRTAPVYLNPQPGIISGYRNTPENWVPPPMRAGGVG